MLIQDYFLLFSFSNSSILHLYIDLVNFTTKSMDNQIYILPRFFVCNFFLVFFMGLGSPCIKEFEIWFCFMFWNFSLLKYLIILIIRCLILKHYIIIYVLICWVSKIQNFFIWSFLNFNKDVYFFIIIFYLGFQKFVLFYFEDV